MENDEKCADAAVRELMNKLGMAKGNIVKAKKLYCGVGPQADAYEVKRREFRKEILAGMEKQMQTGCGQAGRRYWQRSEMAGTNRLAWKADYLNGDPLFLFAILITL